MTKKSRKRRRKRPPPAKAAGETRDPSVKRRRDRDPEGAPAAPWGSFPLVEIAVLVGIVILVLGFLSSGSSQAILIGTGLVLCSIAGLELAIREHFAGYRSHTLILAALPAVVVLGVLFYIAPEGLALVLRLVAGVAAFGLAAWGLTAVFRARSGGHAFRVKAPKRRR